MEQTLGQLLGNSKININQIECLIICNCEREFKLGHVYPLYSIKIPYDFQLFQFYWHTSTQDTSKHCYLARGFFYQST